MLDATMGLLTVLSNVLSIVFLLTRVIRSVQFDPPPLNGNYLRDAPNYTFNPNSPLVKCSYLPLEFLNCSEPEDLTSRVNTSGEDGVGCSRWGNERYEEVAKTKVNCSVLPGIECFGPRTFLKGGFPCIKYNGHYFVTTLIYSVLLGFLGMDRFCLGHTGTAVGKLLTLGGVGIWWIIDIVLLITGMLKPADESNWVPFF